MSRNPGDSLELASDDLERSKRAKRTLVVLVCLIVVLLAALGGLCYIGYTILMEHSTLASQSVTTPLDQTGPEIVDTVAPEEVKVEKTQIPRLAALFGLTVDEVKVHLGNDFQLTKSEEVSDSTNANIKQLVTFAYIPKVSGTAQSATASALPSESIYVSLNEEGKVVDVYYTCDMRLLGYPEKSFNSLLATEDLVVEALSAAGVTPRDYAYVPPADGEGIVYDNPNSDNKKIIKQSRIFSGRTTSDTLPTAWTLTVTYDFGSGVASEAEYKQANRLINLKLA